MMVVVTMTRCPAKIRGDLTKWLLEIDTGVYVGSVSARVRDGLWERITDTIGSGRATMAFSTNGEQKYDFYVWNPEWEPVDFDGIKLIRRKLSTRHEVRSPAARTSGSKPSETTGMNPTRGLFDNTEDHPDYTVIDLETTGLNKSEDEIVEIAALRVRNGVEEKSFQRLIQISRSLPPVAKELTHLSDEDLKERGVNLEHALCEFKIFVGNDLLVGYNIQFDLDFLNEEAMRCGFARIENPTTDAMALARKKLKRRSGVSLSRVADDLNIHYDIRHRAAPDCSLTYKVFEKLKKMGRDEFTDP